MAETQEKKAGRYYTRITKSGNYYDYRQFEQPVFYGFTTKDRAQSVRKPTERRADNVQRSRNRLVHKVLANSESQKPLFLTLTYQSNMQDRAKAVQDFKRYIRFLRAVYGRVDYVYVLETQERGAWHLHVLIFNRRYMKIQMLRAAWRYITAELARVNIERTESTLHSARYISKYLGKESVDPGNRLYSASIGLLKPIVMRHDSKWGSFSIPFFGTCEYSHAYFDADGNVINIDIFYDETRDTGGRLRGERAS